MTEELTELFGEILAVKVERLVAEKLAEHFTNENPDWRPEPDREIEKVERRFERRRAASNATAANKRLFTFAQFMYGTALGAVALKHLLSQKKLLAAIAAKQQNESVSEGLGSAIGGALKSVGAGMATRAGISPKLRGALAKGMRTKTRTTNYKTIKAVPKPNAGTMNAAPVPMHAAVSRQSLGATSSAGADADKHLDSAIQHHNTGLSLHAVGKGDLASLHFRTRDKYLARWATTASSDHLKKVNHNGVKDMMSIT